jgi:hypothetical protein
MKFISASTDGRWVETESGDPKGSPEYEEAGQNKKKLQQCIRDVLSSENLIILCGLGTSLCLNKDRKPAIAPTMPDLWKAAQEIAGGDFDEIKTRVNYASPKTGDDVELLLSLCHISQILNRDDKVESFIARTEAMIVGKCRFVSKDTQLDVHSAFLRKIARRSTRKPRVRIFTTNYDLCFETAASRIRFVLVDGFTHTQPQEFDGAHFELDLVRRDSDRDAVNYVGNVVHLYKLHGSVDWEERNGQIFRSELPEKPVMVYPRATKFEMSYNQPYFEIMSRFQSSLRQANTGLLVVGCGFNDTHISQPLMAAVASNINLKALIVSPGLHEPKKPDLQKLGELVKDGDWRLSLAAMRFEDFVPLIPDLYAETEEEQHSRRVTGRKS